MNRCWFRRATVLLLGLTLLSSFREARAQTSDQALLAAIAEAWQRREEATRSVEIAWEESETIPQGALTNHPALIASGQPPDKGPRPPTDVTLEHRKSAVLSGNQISYEGTKDRLGANSEVWKDRYLSTFDGQQSKNLWYPQHDAPVGQIWNEPFYHDRSSFDVVPILLSFRPGNSVMGKVDLQKCRVSRARPAGANSDCVILVEDIARGSRVEYWLRPKADYALVHRTAISNGVVETDDDIQYTRDPASGVWLPAEWKITWFKLWDGKIYFTLRGRVTSCKLGVETHARTFDIAFPRDALVSIMGATPESTVDLVERRASLFEWSGLLVGLLTACLLAAHFLRRHLFSRRASPPNQR